MAGLIRFLFILLVIYLGVRFILRPLIILLLQHMVKKMANNTMEDFKRQNEPKNSRPEGSIFVDYIPTDKSTKTPKKDDGEYVDFEELK